LLTLIDSAIGCCEEKWLKKQQKLQVDPASTFKIMFLDQCKIFDSEKVKQLGLSFTKILERCYKIQHMLWNEKLLISGKLSAVNYTI